MAVNTFTKSGAKSATPAKLDKDVFGAELKSHEVLKQVYLAYLSNGRGNYAQTLRRGQVSGGGKKPWRQKGTGRARFGSSRNPIWRGGGVAFGPTGAENYSKKVSPSLKRLALKQALSLASGANKITVIDEFEIKSGKSREAAGLLAKIGANGRTLVVSANIDAQTDLAVRNLESVKYMAAGYLNVYDVVNADIIVITKDGLPEVVKLAGGKK